MIEQKLVPELRFPEFNGSWEETTFQEISTVNQGLQIAIEKRFKEKVENSHFYLTNEFLKEGSKVAYYIVNPPESVLCSKDDILMTRTGNTGIVVTDVEGAFHNNFFKIEFDRKLLDKDFLVQTLRSYNVQKDMLIRAEGSTILDLNHSEFYKVKIHIPEISEQKKIVGFLYQLDQKIELQREKLENLEKYKKTMMLKIFNQEVRFKDDNGEEYPKWENKSMEEIGTFYNGLRGKDKDHFIKGNKKYIQYLNIFNNTVIDNDFNNFDYVSIEENENQNQVKYGDLLFTQSSETIEEVGMTCVYLGNKEVYLNSFSFGFRMNNENDINYEYIAHFFETDSMRRKIIREGQGSTRMNLSSNRLKPINVALPVVSEQKKIADYLSLVDKKISLQKKRVEDYKEYKRGLLQKMFI